MNQNINLDKKSKIAKFFFLPFQLSWTQTPGTPGFHNLIKIDLH